MKFALLLDLTLSCILLWQVQAGSKSKKTKAKFCKDCYVYNGLKSSCHSCANCLFYHYDETCRPGKPLKGDDDKIGCGCNECNADVLHSYADGFTCEWRIDFAQSDEGDGLTEEEACVLVSETYDACGKCNPLVCDGNRPNCGCELCTDEIYNTDAEGSTCGERIEYLIGTGESEDDACTAIAEEFSQCALCNPICEVEDTSTPTTFAPTTSGTRMPTFAPTTSGTRMPTFAPTTSGTRMPTFAPTSSPTPDPTLPEPEYCGCYDCTQDVWNTMAGTFTCGARIEYLQTDAEGDPLTEEEACIQVARNFQAECGACNPETCDAPTSAPTIVQSSQPSGWPSGSPSTNTTIDCDCPEYCTSEVLSSNAEGNQTCLDLINFVQELDPSSTEVEACLLVATEYSICEPCNPQLCDVPTTVPTSSPITSTPTDAPDEIDCDCPQNCTPEVLSSDAENGQTCLDLINFAQELDPSSTEAEACLLVATEYPVCEPCNPQLCDVPTTTVPPTSSPITSTPTDAPDDVDCDCPQYCTPEVLSSDAENGQTCLDLINFAQELDPSSTEAEACLLVATEYPVCEPCNPQLCDEPTTTAPTTSSPVISSPTNAPEDEIDCNCPEFCTEEVLGSETEDLQTCLELINFALAIGGAPTEAEACLLVSTEYPECEACNPQLCDSPSPTAAPFDAPPMVSASPTIYFRCGCTACTQEVLDRDADGVSCSRIIDFYMDPSGGNLEESLACIETGFVYPICEPCSPNSPLCNPP